MGPAALRYGSSAIPAACLALAAVGCAPEPVTTGFAETGELVALSGGDAGARGACHTCHGEDGRGAGRGNPTLVGQPAPYLAQQLRAWRSGERYGDPKNVMLIPARALAEHEINPLAEYIARIGDGSGRPGFPAECPAPRRPDPRSGA